MLGVVIGVASVVALVGIGQGTTSSITQRLAGLGTNLLTVSPTQNGTTGSGTLTLDDADAVAQLPTVGAVAPELSTQAVVASGPTNTTTTIVGTTAPYPDVRPYPVLHGAVLASAAHHHDLRVSGL